MKIARALWPIVLFAAACHPDTCTDIECVMGHFSITIDGQAQEIVALPANLVPTPSLQSMTAVGDFPLLVTPISAPNWGEPVEMMEYGILATRGLGTDQAGLAPAITNQPAPLTLASPSSDGDLSFDFVDPNAEEPAFCFTPYDASGGRPYPHCVWCTRGGRDGLLNGRIGQRAGIDAIVQGKIDFDTPTGKACKNPPLPNGQARMPGLPGCRSGTKPCGNGCIPANAVCCNAVAEDRTSYCTNAAGGGCYIGACAGGQHCCDPSGTIPSNDCAPNQHHCGLQCTSIDNACCPLGSSDPACHVPLVAGEPAQVAVNVPRQPGGNVVVGGDCNYFVGVWAGDFNYTFTDGPQGVPGMGSIHATFTFESYVTGGGLAVFKITHAVVDDPTFGAQGGVTPAGSISLADLPCGDPGVIMGVGITVDFPNGSHLHTANGPGELFVSADHTVLSSSANPAEPTSTWGGGGSVADSNTAGSGPGGHAYNATQFRSWRLVHQ